MYTESWEEEAERRGLSVRSTFLLCKQGSTPTRTGGFLGTSSPGPMAELYGAANQESAVSSYISAASPAPSTGFGHSLGVSGFDLLCELV